MAGALGAGGGERGLGALEDLGGPLGGRRGPDRGAHADRDAGDEGPGAGVHGVQGALQDAAEGEGVDAGEEEHELVVLPPRHHVVLAAGRAKVLADAAEEVVAGLVAEALVDGAHPVDVDAGERVADPLALGPAVLAEALLLEAAAVDE